jgi:peptide/nickel transport system substrate-binding protein/microcin C transport system substrate-binding protein
MLALLFTAQTTPALAAFTGPAEAAKADQSATLNRYIASYPKTLNPLIYTSADEITIMGRFTIFESIIELDPDTGDAECWLCTSFDYDAKDKRIATFKLRKDVTFHDGKKLTAHDVQFTFNAVMHPKVDNLNLKSDVIAAIEKVEVVDDYTVRFVFKDVKYANVYTLETIKIVPKHLFSYFAKSPEKFNKDTKFGRNPVGSGPYKFKKWQAGKYVEVVKNDKWWGWKDPRFKNSFNFEKVRFKVITNDNVAIQAFRKGEFDFMSLQSYQYDDLRKTKEKLKVAPMHLEPKVGTSFMFLGWNGRLPKFSDVNTRKALTMLTNRELALEKFSRGLRPPTNGPWGIDSPYQCPKDKCPVIAFDPTKAKALLAEAGWKDSDKDGCLDRTVDGKKQVLKFPFLASEGDWVKNVLNVYVSEMKKAGVCASIRQLDWTALTKLVDDLNFETYVSGFQAGYPILPRQLWHSENTKKTGSNSWNFVDKEADQLIADFEKEFDSQKRIAIGQKIHKKIYDSHTITFHHEGGGCYVGHNNDLKGLQVADFRPDCVYWPRWYKNK